MSYSRSADFTLTIHDNGSVRAAVFQYSTDVDGQTDHFMMLLLEDGETIKEVDLNKKEHENLQPFVQEAAWHILTKQHRELADKNPPYKVLMEQGMYRKIQTMFEIDNMGYHCP